MSIDGAHLGDDYAQDLKQLLNPVYEHALRGRLETLEEGQSIVLGRARKQEKASFTLPKFYEEISRRHLEITRIENGFILRQVLNEEGNPPRNGTIITSNPRGTRPFNSNQEIVVAQDTEYPYFGSYTVQIGSFEFDIVRTLGVRDFKILEKTTQWKIYPYPP